ncbi:maleate cis-trans isomerase family protein [Streptomyces sp. 4N509B]|uniref:maleate cis-trans isomerase family protein n=1 Tax=Streptomyces sp. 4N509B TaxID=3457413 RepID=UPI003FD36481
MPNAVGYRAIWGVVIPSTSTTVEHDFAVMRPPGITFHAGRSMIHRPDMRTNEAAISVLDQMDASRDEAIEQVMTTRPDHLVVAMSAEIIRNGAAGAEAFVRDLEDRFGVGVTTGPTACAAALRELRCSRVGVLTPYQPVSDTKVVEYFGEVGIEVRRIHGLRCTSATAIAEVSPERVASALRELDGDDVDALVQVGTNLSAVRPAAAVELVVGKPVLAMNAVTLWHALRRNGFADTYADFGTLLRDH